MQHAEAVFIDYECNGFSVIGEIELVDVPRNIAGEISMFLGREINIGQTLKFRVLVGGDENAFAILAEPAVVVGDLFRAAFGRNQGLLATLRVYDPEVGFIGRNFFYGQNLARVRRPIESLPTAPLQWGEQVVTLGISGFDLPKINIVPVTSRRSVNQPVACVRPYCVSVARLAVGEKRDIAARNIVAIELKKLATSHVLGEYERIIFRRRIMGASDTIGIESQLGACSARHLHQMNLVGISETRGDQNLAFYGIPTVESRSAKVAIALHRFRDRHGNLRNALGYKVLVRSDDIILREDDRGQ